MLWGTREYWNTGDKIGENHFKLGRRFSLISADKYSISSLYLKSLQSAFIRVQKGNSIQLNYQKISSTPSAAC
jgi:hypothetical protein